MPKNQPLKKRHVGIKCLGKIESYIAVLSAKKDDYAVISTSKLRVQEAFVHAIYNRKTGRPVEQVSQFHYWNGRKKCLYRVGEIVLPDDFDTSNESCGGGIHLISMCLPNERFLLGWNNWMGAMFKANIGDMLALDRALWELKNG